MKKGDVDAAIGDFSDVIRLDPKAAEAYRMRGMLYLSKDDFGPAINDFTVLLKFNSTNSVAYANRMGAYWLKGDYQNAVADCKTLVRLNPGDGDYWNKLAMMLATCPAATARNGKEAVEAATKACGLSAWQMPPYIATLAAAYAESGDFKQAVNYQQQALAMLGWPASARDAMKKRLELYQQGKPFHDVPFSGDQSSQNLPQQSLPTAASGADEPASMVKTNAHSILTNSVLLEIDAAATYLKDLKKQGQLPGVSTNSPEDVTTSGLHVSDLKELKYPFAMTFLATFAGDSFTNHYTAMQPAADAAWQLERAWQTDPQGRTVKEWPVSSVPKLHATGSVDDLGTLAAMEKDISSQSTREALMRELRAAATFLAELGKHGSLPGIPKNGRESVTTGALPRLEFSKGVTYPFAVTFYVNVVGEPFTNHYTLMQPAKDAAWQFEKAWRTDSEGRTVKEWPVK